MPLFEVYTWFIMGKFLNWKPKLFVHHFGRPWQEDSMRSSCQSFVKSREVGEAVASASS